MPGGSERERANAIQGVTERAKEQEGIKGILQIEVAWSRVPGAESTGPQHTQASLTPYLSSLSSTLYPAFSLSNARWLPCLASNT